MPALIVYQTNYGFAERVAETIKSGLDDAVNVVKFSAHNPPTLDLYDTVVVIQSIRLGQVQPELKLWVNSSANALIEKRLVLGICCGFSENIEQYLSVYDPRLISHALFSGSFGGELTGNYKLFDKFIVSMVKKQQQKQGRSLPVEDTAAIAEVIQLLNNSYDSPAVTNSSN